MLQPGRMVLPATSGKNTLSLIPGVLYRGFEVSYSLTEKEILAACEGVRAASEVIGTEAQLLLAPQPLLLGRMFEGKVPSTHHATDAMLSKWSTLITQQACIGKPDHPGTLEDTTNWPEGKDFRPSSSEEEEKVTCAEESHHTTSYQKTKSNTLSSLSFSAEL